MQGWLREQKKGPARKECHDHLLTDDQLSRLIAGGIEERMRTQGASLGSSHLRARGLQEQKGSPYKIPQP